MQQASAKTPLVQEDFAAVFREVFRELFIDNLLVPIHFIIVMIRWNGLAPWSLNSLFQVALHLAVFPSLFNDRTMPTVEKTQLTMQVLIRMRCMADLEGRCKAT